ncbi:MAG: DUF2784 family protein [Gammaproteobacteria bacterium]|nr:DUF2784 family protein [Gammaproteobacteria bacterium]
MFYGLLADAVLVLHLAFILFVLLGALLVWRWPHVAWAHLPAVAWGVLLEFFGWLCPLTPLEVALRRAAGEDGFGVGFIEHYLAPLIYPAGLTPGIQFWIGGGVLVLNLLLYGGLWWRLRKRTT